MVHALRKKAKETSEQQNASSKKPGISYEKEEGETPVKAARQAMLGWSA